MMSARNNPWPMAVVFAVLACAMTSRAEAQSGAATGGGSRAVPGAARIAGAEGDSRTETVAIEDGDTDEQVASTGYIIPDAPALTILDATASKLERPGSARELGVSLANIVGKDGTIKAGLAVEITPSVFGLSRKWSYYQYRRDYWRRLLVRSGLSVGTAAGGGSEMGAAADTRLGIGARIVLWDEADPLLDTNLDSQEAFLKNAVEKGACNGLVGAELTLCEGSVLAEFKSWEKPRWNAGGMSVAVAQAFALKESKLGNIDSDAFQAWASAGLPLGALAQLAMGASFEYSFVVEEATAAGALKLRAGGERFRAALDGTYVFARPDADPYRGKLAIGVEVELSANTWLTGALAADIDEEFDASQVFAVSSIKWGYASKPSWQLERRQLITARRRLVCAAVERASHRSRHRRRLRRRSIPERRGYVVGPPGVIHPGALDRPSNDPFAAGDKRGCPDRIRLLSQHASRLPWNGGVAWLGFRPKEGEWGSLAGDNRRDPRRPLGDPPSPRRRGALAWDRFPEDGVTVVKRHDRREQMMAW